MRTRLVLVGLLAALALAVPTTGSAVPGSGTNAIPISLTCDSGVGELTLISEASLAGLFATAHIVGSNRPAPLISLDFEVFSNGELVDSGSFGHEHPQQGQPIVTCRGSFMIGDLTVVFTSTGFFPAGT
jgi:hypothetical protein